MQEKGEMSSKHAKQAIGILLIQDLAAVIFLSATKGTVPEFTALLLPLLWFMREPILRLLVHAGHGELFTLAGMGMALGGAILFELVGLKGDLGALVLGAFLVALAAIGVSSAADDVTMEGTYVWTREDGQLIYPFECDPDSFFRQLYNEGRMQEYIDRTPRRP